MIWSYIALGFWCGVSTVLAWSLCFSAHNFDQWRLNRDARRQLKHQEREELDTPSTFDFWAW